MCGAMPGDERMPNLPLLHRREHPVHGSFSPPRAIFRCAV
jgi:hypothetical protein